METLTLYSIETQLLELLAYREDLLSGEFDMDEAERKELIQVAEDRIKEYVTKEVAKVDGVAAMLREFSKREAIEKEEAQRITARAKRWAERKERLESMVISIMQQIGSVKLDGKHSTLALKKCPPSVDVAQPELVPMEYERITVTMPHVVWDELFEVAGHHMDHYPLTNLVKENDPEPMKAEIAKALKSFEQCQTCTAAIETTGNPVVDCLDCKGTGTVPKGVPGCRLISDRVRLEVS